MFSTQTCAVRENGLKHIVGQIFGFVNPSVHCCYKTVMRCSYNNAYSNNMNMVYCTRNNLAVHIHKRGIE